jgi:hypothetical protein
MDDILEVAKGPGETVNPGYHQRVTFPHELKQRCQLLAPLGAGAGYLLRSDYGVYPSKSIIALTCTSGQALDFVSVGGAAACPTIVARQGGGPGGGVGAIPDARPTSSINVSCRAVARTRSASDTENLSATPAVPVQ